MLQSNVCDEVDIAISVFAAPRRAFGPVGPLGPDGPEGPVDPMGPVGPEGPKSPVRLIFHPPPPSGAVMVPALLSISKDKEAPL